MGLQCVLVVVQVAPKQREGNLWPLPFGQVVSPQQIGGQLQHIDFYFDFDTFFTEEIRHEQAGNTILFSLKPFANTEQVFTDSVVSLLQASRA